MSHQQKPNEVSGNARMFAILAYIIPIVGGIIGLAVNRGNTFTRHHAQQSIGAILTLIASFIVWGISAYVVSLVPAIRPTIVSLTYILIVLGFLAALYYIGKLDEADKMRNVGIRRLIGTVVIYGIGGIIYWLSQTNPDIVGFAVPIIELLSPVGELFMPVLLLATILTLGGNIFPTRLSLAFSLTITINLLTWMPLAGPVIAIALYGLVVAMVIFLMVNWGIGLVNAIRGKQWFIPIANTLTKRIFGDIRKQKVNTVTNPI